MSSGRGILSLRFNQDQGCFTCCMESGLRIYNVEPLVEQAHYESGLMGSIAIAEMLWRSNIIAIVGGGSKPKYADNVILLFDDYLKKFIMEITCAGPIKAVRLRKDKLIVALQREIHVFSFPIIRRLLTLETRDNPNGLMEITTLASAPRQLLVFPGHKTGSVQLVDLGTTEAGTSSAPTTLPAHQGELACLAVNNTGTMIATASERGTLIRVWDSITRKRLVELRRGTDHATVYCISFSRDSDYLCVSGDKGTVHIFAIKDTHLNKKSTFSKMGFLGGTYVDSQWALTNFTVPPESPCVCAFGSKNSVIAVCMDGTFHKYVFTPDGKNCNREAYDVFLDACNDDDF